jgi:hypothetical protein
MGNVERKEEHERCCVVLWWRVESGEWRVESGEWRVERSLKVKFEDKGKVEDALRSRYIVEQDGMSYGRGEVSRGAVSVCWLKLFHKKKLT